jgi:F-type H+-transporting ATPase subunit epsilon
MYEKPFSLEIIAPDRVVLHGEAGSVSAPGTQGGFQVLYNHAPLLSTLRVGRITVKDTAGAATVFATSGGYLEVRDNKVVVLVETAELAGEIDLERARAAKERAEQRLKSHDPSVDVVRAEAALKRALNRLRCSSTSTPIR